MAKSTHGCIGVLGGGSIGLRHAANLRRLGVEDLVVFEPQAAARERFPANLASSLVADADEFWLRGPKAVFICTPSANHLADARVAIEHGCDIFVEKPLAGAIDGCSELAAEVTRQGRIAMVACNMRFHPGPAAVKRLLDENRIGPVLSARLYTGSYLPRWRPWQNYRLSYSADPSAGGAILDCIHEIDLALWHLGPAKLRAAAARKGGVIGLEQTDVLAELLLDHESGALGSLHLNFVQRNYSRGCEMIGALGTIRWDFATPAVSVYGEDGALSETIALPADYDLNAMYLDEAEHFLGCVRSRSAPCNPIESGLAALEIALAAREFAR